jgi:hypothetical protein
MSDPPPKHDPTGMSAHPFDEETSDPWIADARNFYMIEKWTKDRTKVDCMLFASSSLDKARRIFAEVIKHRPRIRLTIRQKTQVLEQWPKPDAARWACHALPITTHRR